MKARIPEVADCIQLAHEALEEAQEAYRLGSPILLPGVARASYYTAYHAAEAFIVYQEGVPQKGHDKARSRFGQLVKDDPRFDRELKKFLGSS